MTNATLSTEFETNFHLVLICFLRLQLLEKVKNKLTSKSIPNQDLFQTPVLNLANLAWDEYKWRTNARLTILDTEESLKQILIWY